MRLAVVLPCVAVRGDGDGLLVLSDLQLAGLVGDGVVLGKRIVLQSVTGDGVGAGTDKRLAANDRHGGKAFSVHKRALGDRVVAVGQRRAVVRLAGAGRRQLDCNRRYRQLTNNGLAEGVARGHVGFAAHDYVARYHVVAAADVRLAALDNRGQNVALHQRARVGEAVIRQRRAVVNLLVALRGDGNGLALALALRDGQLTLFLGDGIVRLLEVRAFGVGDRVGHFALVHEGYAAGGLDIGHLARHKAVAGHGDIRLRQRRAVVFLARRLGLQRHGALVDGQLAVRHDERHLVEVAAVVHKLRLVQTHRVAVRVNGRLLGLAVEVEVGSRIPVVADAFHIVARHGVLVAIIRRRSRMTLDRHGHFVFDRVDPEVFLSYRDVIVRLFEVRAGGIGDVVQHLALVHVRHAAVGLDVGHFAVHKAVAGHGDIRSRQRRAVVGLVRFFGGQRHDAPVDGQAAVRHDERHVGEVAVLVRKVGILQTHRVRGVARVGGLYLGGAGEGEVRFLIKLVADAYVVARRGVLRAVVLRGHLVTRDRHDHFVGHGRNFQLARGRGDGVVVRVRAFVQRVGEIVGHLADVRDRAGHVKRRAFAIREARTADGHVAVRQRLAVVGLAVARGRQRYLTLVDGQLAVDGISEGVVPGHVHVAAHDPVALNDVLAFVAHVRGAALDDRGQHVAFRQHAFGEGEAVIRQRGSVVGLAGAVRGDDDLRLDRGDRHIAVDHCLDGHVVVGAGDGEGVLGQTHVRRANVRAPGDGE